MKTTIKKIFFISFALVSVIFTFAQSKKEKEMIQKAKSIISQLTLDEKISQLTQDAKGIDRLGIKPYYWLNEALHGVGRDGRATVFPQPISLGATFDPEIVQQIGDAIATEGRAKFIVAQRQKNYSMYAGLTFWAPNVNIFRDPRWGRGMETYGEDPFLTGVLGTAFVKGMQGNDPFYLKAAACGKHFAVHSGPERTRHTANVEPTKHDLYETYLPAFKMLVQQGKVESIMGAYQRLYGESCSGSKYLLTDILRKDWGFKGHVVSDCGAVTDMYEGHKLVKSEAEAVAFAIKAGLNLECGNSMRTMKDALKQKLITEKDLDKALLPLMMTRLKLGILQPDAACPYNEFPESVIGSVDNRNIAQRAAEESMVLLKNDGVLPIAKDIRTLFVTGPGATDAYYLMGNYFGLSDRYSTYLEGIVGKVSNGTSVNYKQGFMQVFKNLNDVNWSVSESRGAEVSIIIMGNSGNTEGEEGDAIASSERGDRVDLRLPEPQMQYLREVSKDRTNKLVVVLTGGSPIDVKEITELADAVVMAWYPGQEGGVALANLLFGDTNFSGRLPVTFPETTDKLPSFDDYSMKGRTYKYMTDNILYPFGYGLSYGKVAYGNATVTKLPTKHSPMTVSVDLSNDGNMPVDEVVQVYLSTPSAGVTSPIESLVAFKRVKIAPHATVTTDFEIPVERLETVQEDGTSKLLKGEYRVMISGAAPCNRSKELGVSCSTATFKL
ncbi:glycoside hydrolase family 3 N-terminal domain-containing protein [Hoylesella oralis]|uniref:glycoside hydrolase family 3 N-terminal domain-containing protein n=1 Tax=Hoylesella oralis TaxID=28134 RepID=UPI0028E30D87|nr:glycoside hydrolase family 3 N-terminal domain-containing protein [Hoylesella oralis]